MLNDRDCNVYFFTTPYMPWGYSWGTNHEERDLLTLALIIGMKPPNSSIPMADMLFTRPSTARPLPAPPMG
jgi:hypothetical protein